MWGTFAEDVAGFVNGEIAVLGYPKDKYEGDVPVLYGDTGLTGEQHKSWIEGGYRMLHYCEYYA